MRVSYEMTKFYENEDVNLYTLLDVNMSVLETVHQTLH
jgi:hypothetical protein